MFITKRMVERKIAWRFEIYEKRLKSETKLQHQKEEYHRMTGIIIAMLMFGLIEEEKYDALWDKSREIFIETELEQ